MQDQKNRARAMFLRQEPLREIAKVLSVEEARVERWAREGGWDVLRDAVQLEVAALRATEAEAADERYAAISDAIRGMAAGLVAKLRGGASVKGAELLALTRTVKEALEIRAVVERRRSDRLLGRR